MKRLAWALLALTAGGLTGCPTRSVIGNLRELMIDSFETSPEQPVELCGNEETVAFLMALRCANGQAAYPSVDKALASRDLGYEGRSPSGERLARFTAVCYQKEYVLYLAPEQCPEGRKPAFPFFADSKKG